ncbi:MAG: DNA-processing protein DprA [Opitutales bacterium]|nr:DNA-processing protein DprA [Opitutales bacterium]
MELSREDAYLVLNALPRIGWVTLQILLKHFQNDPRCILRGKEADFQQVGITTAAYKNLSQWETLFRVEVEKQRLASMGAQFLSFEHPDYPALLKTIYDPPIGLYFLGKLRPSTQTIALVGSRYATLYGLHLSERWSAACAERGWCIVSGFARGVDTAAHRGALRVKGATAAVLGCGLDRIYPPENADLYAQLREQGCLLSEFPLGTRADRMTFPRRNRILSGMSQATVVIESDLKGGSMLAAAFANEQNRPVFAVPGSVDSAMSRGCHHLIRNGATLATSVEDILEDLQAAPPLPLQLDLEEKIQTLHRKEVPALSGVELQVYHLLKSKGALGSSEICAACEIAPEEVQTALFSLEWNRWIVRRNDGLFEI